MDLQEVTLDREAAKEKFIEYRDAVRARMNDEDALIARSFKIIASGKPIIALTSTLQAGGRTPAGLPRLAVCRADAKRCYLERCSYIGAFTLVTKRHWEDRRAHNNTRDVRSFPEGTLPPLDLPPDADRWVGPNSPVVNNTASRYAIVPIVPPALRPARGLGGYEILWEVDEWLVDPKPPVDPALLKHVAGDLYAVVAVWDLTDLERMVIAARADAS